MDDALGNEEQVQLWMAAILAEMDADWPVQRAIAKALAADLAEVAGSFIGNVAKPFMSG